MEIQGKVVKILPLQQGENARGGWKKQDFVLETPGQYPKQVCISLWGDKIDQNPIAEGEEITASINVESREFNERWYTDVKAWKVQKTSGGGADTDGFNQEAPSFPPPPPSNDDDDVLPF